MITSRRYALLGIVLAATLACAVLVAQTKNRGASTGQAAAAAPAQATAGKIRAPRKSGATTWVTIISWPTINS